MDRTSRRTGFTLIELLVVIAILSAIIAILLPSLSRARNLAKLTTCGSQMRQLVSAVHSYGIDHQDRFPAGPGGPFLFDPTTSWADNAMIVFYSATAQSYAAHGLLVEQKLIEPDLLFCPGDEFGGTSEEWLASHRTSDGLSSYLFRHLQQTSRSNVSTLGRNETNDAAQAILLDANQSAPMADWRRRNHNGTDVNIAFLDGHVSHFGNDKGAFSVTQKDFAEFPRSLRHRIDQILIAADFAAGGDPNAAPKLEARKR